MHIFHNSITFWCIKWNPTLFFFFSRLSKCITLWKLNGLWMLFCVDLKCPNTFWGHCTSCMSQHRHTETQLWRERERERVSSEGWNLKKNTSNASHIISKDESNLTAISSLALPPVSRMIVSGGLSARSHPLPTGHGRFALRLLTWTVGASESRLISCCLHLTLCRENNVVKPPEIGNLQQRWKWKARYSSVECFL